MSAICRTTVFKEVVEMVNYYLIEIKDDIYLTKNQNNVYSTDKVDGSIVNILTSIILDVAENKIEYFTIYTTNQEILHEHGNMGFNLRYGSLEDEEVQND